MLPIGYYTECGVMYCGIFVGEWVTVSDSTTTTGYSARGGRREGINVFASL